MKVSKDTKVTLTLGQIQKIAEKAAQNAVRTVITEMIDEGAFDGSASERKQIEEQRKLIETFNLLQEQMEMVADKIKPMAGVKRPAKRASNDPSEMVYDIGQDPKKFDRAKAAGERAAAEASRNMGTAATIINETAFGGYQPEFESYQEEAAYQQRATQVATKIEEVKQRAGSDDEAAILEAMFED